MFAAAGCSAAAAVQMETGPAAVIMLEESLPETSHHTGFCCDPVEIQPASTNDVEATIIQAEIHGRTIEVGCYGAATDWVCRLTDASSQPGPHNDAYCPPPDLGFVWLRESHDMWLASGLVNREIVQDADAVNALLYRVMKDVIHDDSQLASCIEFVGAEFTATFNGEEGPAQFPGSAVRK